MMTQTLTGIAALGLVGSLALNQVLAVVNAPLREPRHLEVTRLEYVRGPEKDAVLQQISPTHAGPINAAWLARIERKRGDGTDAILCEGHGEGVYAGEVSVWVLDDWTGDDCPDRAQDGDVFEVSWTYRAGRAFNVTIGGRYRLEGGKLVQID